MRSHGTPGSRTSPQRYARPRPKRLPNLPPELAAGYVPPPPPAEPEAEAEAPQQEASEVSGPNVEAPNVEAPVLSVPQPPDQTALALSALHAVELDLAHEAALEEDAERRAWQRRQAEFRVQRLKDHLGEWPLEKVQRLAAAGRLTPEQIALWADAREAFLHRQRIALLTGKFSWFS